MHNVSTRPRRTPSTTARRLRALLREQRISSTTLASILGCSRARAIRLRYWSEEWTCTELFRVVRACMPERRLSSLVVEAAA